jgi:hypothetical protein
VLDVMVEFLHNWLEDNIADKLYEGMEKTLSQFSNMDIFTKTIKSLFERYTETRLGNFQEQLNKLQETETIK